MRQFLIAAVFALMMVTQTDARLTKSGHLAKNGISLGALHNSAMKHHAKVSQYRYLKAEAEDDESTFSISESLGYADWIVDVEYFLLGFLNGLSFEGFDVCSTGLSSAVIAGIDCIQYIEVYIPENTMKFTLATVEL